MLGLFYQAIKFDKAGYNKKRLFIEDVGAQCAHSGFKKRSLEKGKTFSRAIFSVLFSHLQKNCEEDFISRVAVTCFTFFTFFPSSTFFFASLGCDSVTKNGFCLKTKTSTLFWQTTLSTSFSFFSFPRFQIPPQASQHRQFNNFNFNDFDFNNFNSTDFDFNDLDFTDFNFNVGRPANDSESTRRCSASLLLPVRRRRQRRHRRRQHRLDD
jgi:hypothetical protein